MSTWHTSEPPLEVTWLFVMNMNFDAHDFSHFLLVELGAANGVLENAVIRAATDPEQEAEEVDPS